MIAQQYEYEFKQITTVESVVAGGIGRSRMITTSSKGNIEEVKMKNFFSLTGINFGNIRQNDKQIAEKLTQLSNEGWEFISVNTGVYSGGIDNALVANSGVGLFITRYLFKRRKK